MTASLVMAWVVAIRRLFNICWVKDMPAAVTSEILGPSVFEGN